MLVTPFKHLNLVALSHKGLNSCLNSFVDYSNYFSSTPFPICHSQRRKLFLSLINETNTKIFKIFQ